MRKINNKTIAEQILNQGRMLKAFAAVAVIIFCGILYSCRGSVSEGLSVDEQTGAAQTEQDIQMTVTADNTIGVPQEQHCYVYVCGSVNNPGVYEALEDARVYMLVEQAGGLAEDAAGYAVNMAEPVRDGQTIYIPSKEEADNGSLTGDTKQTAQTQGKININTAGKEQLMTLKGIGASKADDIISYRNANGKFNAIEDIMNISGIKEAAYNKIKDDICVK